MLNMMVSMAKADIPVGLVGLDEAPWLYVVKMLSVWTGRTQEWVEERWDEPEGVEVREAWKAFARGKVHLYGGRRPAFVHLDQAMEFASLGSSRAPAVLFIDYLKLLTRDGAFGYGDNSRLPQLVEELQVWSTTNNVAVVLLHQLSRNDEYGGANSRNAGHIPVTLSQLMYGGEDSADLVLGTYRPAMNPMGLMSNFVAQEVLGDRFDMDVYLETQATVKREANSTYLQLLKNRPGTHREERGVELVSKGECLAMYEKEAEEPSERENKAERRGRP